MNFSYYGLSLNLSGLGLNVYQVQLLFGAVEVPSKLLVYVLVRRAGRRLTQAGTLLGTALALGARLLVTSGEPHPEAPPPGPELLPSPAHHQRPLLHALIWGTSHPGSSRSRPRSAHCLNPFSSRDGVLEHRPGSDWERFF